MAVEDPVGELVDPENTLANLAVRHERHVRAEGRANGAEHLLGGIVGKAPHQHQIFGHDFPL